MKQADYKGACDGMIKTLYHFLNSTLDTNKTEIQITAKEQRILQGLANKILDVLEEATIIPGEALESPTKEKI